MFCELQFCPSTMLGAVGLTTEDPNGMMGAERGEADPGWQSEGRLTLGSRGHGV